MNNNKLCENKKWELVNFCEFDKYAEKSYCAIHNVDSSKNLGDITKVDEENLSPFNMICGGSPCQDFSVAGKQKGSIWTCKDCSHEYNPLTVHWSERDKCPHCGSTNLEKTRSSLLVEYLRVIRSNKPNFGIYENVKNIVGKQFKETTFKLFTDELEEYGYNVYWKVLNAKHYGIPQNRERVYLIFIKKELDNGEFKFPVPFDNGTRLKDILENKVDEKYYISEEKVKKFIKNIHTYESNTSNEQHFIGNINRPDLGTGYAGGVWDKNNISHTLTTMQGGGRQGMTEAQASAAVASMGLASAETTATGATVSLSSALSGLMSTLLANPLILIAASVTAVVSAFSAYKRSIEEAVDKAQEAGNAWEDNNTSLQSNIDKITELRTALDNGTLSEEEAYQAKSDLLEIQDSLTESYGNQVQGLDLINDSLDTQIAKLKELSTGESKRFLNENKKGVEEAEKQMEKERHAYLGQYSDNGSEESNAINQAIAKLKKKYGDDVFKLQEGMEGTGNFEIEFNADASTAKDALNDFMNEIRSIQEQYGESDVLTSLSDYASGGLEEANDILTEYQDLYNQAKQAELFSDKQQYSGKTALEWLNKYEDAVNKYNDAISGGNADEIADAKQYYDDINKSVQVLMNTDASKYSSQFKEIGDQLNTAAIKANEFNQALSGEGENGFQKHLQSVAEEIKKLNMDDADFKAAVSSGDVDSINYLVQAAEQAGIISGTSASEIQPLITALGNLGYISNMSADGLNNVADSASNVEMSFSDLAKEDSSNLLQEISSVQEALDSQSIGISVSYDDFSSDALADYRDCLEYVNGSLVLNEENVKKLTNAKVEEQVATNNTAKAQKQQEYLENAKQIEALRQKLLDNTDATGKSAESIQEQIDGLLACNDAIVDQCSQLDLLNSSLMESIGIYQQWKDAQNSSESGDMFDDAITASKQIDDTLNNTDSDIYGRVGRKDYQASLDFLIPDTVDSTDENAINSYLSSIDNLFTRNEDGERAGLNIEEFCKNAMDKGLMVLDEAGENYQVAGGKTMEDFAEGMNLSMPMVQAMFGEMQEFGANFDWSDEGIQTMGDIAVAATEASEALRSVAGNEDLKINLDVSDLQTTEEKCSALDDTISEMNSVKAKVGVDSSEVDQANTIIQYCVAQKQQLEAPAVMNVDVSQVSGKIGEAVGLLQEFQTAQNTLQMQETLGMDTSEAQANVEAVADKIKGLDTNVKATLSIDDSSIDTIQDSISNKLTNEVMVKAGIDDSAIIGFQETKHDAKGEVDWDNDTTKVDAYAAAQKKSDGKDIEVLERQIAALEGSTSAEDKARKAKLQEQLDSAKEDLNDTITDHAYSMQTDALDKLSADMSEDLDKWINTISSNMEEMTTAINDAVKNAGLSTAGTINAISSILRHYRLSDSEISQSGLTNITGYASGTNYVNKSGIYRVNEKGMESVFSKQYGTLTFLNQGDKVFDANFTKQLLDNSTIATQKNMPDYAGMAKAIEKNIQNIQNLSGNTYVNNFYIDGAQDTESILREIDKHLDKKIQAHDKKQVRDFKSLR